MQAFSTANSTPAEAAAARFEDQRLHTLGAQLQDARLHVRLETVEALKPFGERAVEPLCGALRDADPQVRVAAARALGEVGDDRAIRPLTEALRQSFVGRSARWQAITAIAIVVLLVLAVLGIFFGAMVLKMGAMIGAFGNFIRIAVEAYQKKRRPRSELSLAITEALERIAERDPSPELRAVVPDLHAVAVDVVRQDKEAREASREAAARIEALTEKLKSVPVPASAPAPTPAALPRPADAPQPDPDRLPRVVQ